MVLLSSSPQSFDCEGGVLDKFLDSIYAHSNSDISPRGSVGIHRISEYAELPRNLWLGHPIVVRVIQISDASPREFSGSQQGLRSIPVGTLIHVRRYLQVFRYQTSISGSLSGSLSAPIISITNPLSQSLLPKQHFKQHTGIMTREF